MVGGAETNILKIAKELFNLGFKIHFVVLDDNGPLLDKYDRIIYESFTVINKIGSNPIAQIFAFNKLIKKNKIDYISCFGLRVDLFVRIHKYLYFKSKHKIISNIRASENWRKPIHAFLDRITSGIVHQWVSNSIAGKNAFVNREKLNPNKIRIIYNFIDIDNGFIKSKKIDDKYRIGVLANYKKNKGHYNLIAISQLLSNKMIDHEFICAGHDYTNGDLLHKINEAKRENHFKLIGHIKDKMTFFNKIDVLFLPSYIEGLPTSIIEAMSYNIPVVSSNVDGLPEAIVNNYNGFICDPTDFEMFADYLDKIRNIDIQNIFVENGKKTLNDMFNKEKNIAQWVEVFTN